MTSVWLIAKTPTSQRYPCRCAGRCNSRCWCRGRRDVMVLPGVCCARRVAETVSRASKVSKGAA